MGIMLSPGVATVEKDYSTYVAQVSTTILGMVGGAIKGPLNEPVYISSPDQFLRVFGEPITDSLATYSALQFLQEGNQLWYVRIGNTTVKSSVTIMDTEVIPAELLGITALTEGTWGNDISVSATETDGLTFKLDIYYKDFLVESYLCNLNTSADNYVEDMVVDSQYIDVDDLQMGEGIGTAQNTTDTDGNLTLSELSGGDNGLSAITSTDVIGISGEGLQIFKNTEAIDINILTAPAKSALGDVAKEMLAICESRGDCLAIIDTPMGFTPQDAVDWHDGTGSGEDDPASALNSSYGAIYYPWLQISDPYTSSKIWLPPSGFVSAQMSYNDRVSNPWFAPAGLNRGRIIRANDVEYSCNKGDRDLLYGNGNRVNPIVKFSGDGIVIWGQKTLQAKPSATDRVNVRRLLLMIRKAIAASTRYVTFDPNDEFLWNEWKGMVNPYLDSLKSSRAFYEYQLEMGLGSTMTTTDIDQNKLIGRVSVQPTKSAEFIFIDFILTATGAEFPE